MTTKTLKIDLETDYQIPPKPEVPVLACGHLDLVLVPPKTKRGKAKWVKRWRMWNDNGEMMRDVCRLFVDPKNDRVLDPFYGAGNFWTEVRPKKLVTRDIRIDGFDARTMANPVTGRPAYKPAAFQVIVLDPPYVSQGGRDTSTIPDMQEAYGMYDAPRTPREVQQLIDDSMGAAVPLLVEDGYLMQKTMNYVSSGAIFDSVRLTKEHAESIGLTLVGEFTFSNGLPGPQPGTNLDGSKRNQVHGRNNQSTLLVFQKRKPKRTRKPKGTPISLDVASNILSSTTMLPNEVTGLNVRANSPLGQRSAKKVAPPKPIKKKIVKRGS